jgi:hypothetical protein
LQLLLNFRDFAHSFELQLYFLRLLLFTFEVRIRENALVGHAFAHDVGG